MNHSVFDFLYQDAVRVGSLLSQFDPNGLLVSLTRTDTANSGYENATKSGGGVNVFAAKGELGEEDKVSGSSSSSAQRGFDPRWANSLNLLQLLQNEGLMSRDISTTGLGQIVLTSGTLEIFDVPLLTQLFSNVEVLKNFFEKGAAKKKIATDWKEFEEIFALLTSLPLTVQLMLKSQYGTIWSVLDETCLQTSATNLFLKYGSTLFGTWHMLGILDAKPDPDGPTFSTTKLSGDSAMGLIRHFDGLHKMLGRPQGAYSVTPLLIFRDVARSASPNSGTG